MKSWKQEGPDLDVKMVNISISALKDMLHFTLAVCLIFSYMSVNALFAADLILDPGHSPNKGGAMSSTGNREYIYNDSLVNHIASDLRKKNIDYELTRLPDEDISLIERVKNSAQAKLFISFHHDSVQPQFIRSLHGLPVSEKADGYSIFISRKNDYFNQSLQAARIFAKSLYDSGLRPSTHHGEKIKGENREPIDKKLGIYFFDDLVVLKKSECPAFLFEAGVIVNPEDEKRVRSKQFKTKISKAILNTLKIL